MPEFVMAQVSQGTVRGRRAFTQSGTEFYVYKGIPYGKPPTGNLRFKPPLLADEWSGVRDAISEGNMCPQKNAYTNSVDGEEDCLFINVCTPGLFRDGKTTVYPVMVWIHGGGFTYGSGKLEKYGPDYLIENRVILVTMNYRLGPFGFLYLPSAGIQGNMGLKDQVLALKWVQENIANFCGDKNNVTLFGESSGAASVHFHLISPLSQGLFCRAIAQSGNAIVRRASRRPLEERAFLLGRLLGCDTTNGQELLDYLKYVPARRLASVVDKCLFEEENYRQHMFGFAPEIEPADGADEAMFTCSPLELVKTGCFHKIPFITGITSHEGILYIKELLGNPEALKALNENFEYLVPIFILNKADSKLIPEIAMKIKTFYFGNKPVGEETILNYVNLKTDERFAFGAYLTAKLQSTQSTEPVYFYQFSFSGEYNYLKKAVGAEHLPGAAHADDLGYLFYKQDLHVNPNPGSPEVQEINWMNKLWTNFAKTGNPTPDDELGVVWPPYTTENPAYLNIDLDLTIQKNLLKERMQFWEELFQLVGL